MRNEENRIKGNYYYIKKAFAQIPEIEIRERKGVKFHFPLYLTDAMAKTDVLALDLSVRSSNCLRRSAINTIGDLCERVRDSNDLRGIRGCGNGSIAEIMDKLFAYQYSLLPPEKRGEYLANVAEMNSDTCI